MMWPKRFRRQVRELPLTTPQPRRPWLTCEMRCPTGQEQHHAVGTPWWAGESIYAEFGQRYEQPTGPFFHIVFPAKTGPLPALLRVGDHLLSPAERKELPSRLQLPGSFSADGCLTYIGYDLHAVYVTQRRPESWLPYYEVVPEGRLWPDPEHFDGRSRDWCVARALVTAVNVPNDREDAWWEASEPPPESDGPDAPRSSVSQDG